MAIRTVVLWCESNLWDEIAASHQRFFSLWGEMTTNDIVKIRNPQTRLKRMDTVCPPISQKRRGQLTVSRGKWSLFLHLQLILAFIRSKLIFPYKIYETYTELGLPVIRQERKDSAKIVLNRYWVHASRCLETISNAGQVSIALLDAILIFVLKARFWPPPCQKYDARAA